MKNSWKTSTTMEGELDIIIHNINRGNPKISSEIEEDNQEGRHYNMYGNKDNKPLGRPVENLQNDGRRALFLN